MTRTLGTAPLSRRLPLWSQSSAQYPRRQDGKRFEWSTLLLVSPAGVLITGLLLTPVAYAFYIGLTDASLIGPTAVHSHFTGFTNIRTLYHDPEFRNSAVLTFAFVIGSGAIGATLLGLVLALLMQHASLLLRIVVGAIVVTAWVLPPVTSALLWYAFSTADGTLALVLQQPSADFLHKAPLLTVGIANAWQLTGFSMIVQSAGLRGVPEDLLEAAVIDDVPAWRRLSGIVLPLMQPTIVTTVLLAALMSLGNFTLIYVMTQGGPGDATDIIPVYSYQQAFLFNHLSYGTLVSDVMILAAAILAYGFARSMRRSTSSAGSRQRHWKQ